MHLIIDIGNTQTKIALFETEEPYTKATLPVVEQPEKLAGALEALLKKHQPSRAILSAVVAVPESLYRLVEKHCPLLRLTHKTPVPLGIHYETPETLGPDRLALAVGAHRRYPDKYVLVIDAGTCITYDFVDAQGTYFGGSISPGLCMRLEALYTFTGQLPLIAPEDFRKQNLKLPLIGTDTMSAMCTGVVHGITGEMEYIIAAYRNHYKAVTVLLTGGDASYFESRLKSRIFAAPDILLSGLNQILNYNVADNR